MTVIICCKLCAIMHNLQMIICILIFMFCIILWAEPERSWRDVCVFWSQLQSPRFHTPPNPPSRLSSMTEIALFLTFWPNIAEDNFVWFAVRFTVCSVEFFFSLQGVSFLLCKVVESLINKKKIALPIGIWFYCAYT